MLYGPIIEARYIHTFTKGEKKLEKERQDIFRRLFANQDHRDPL